MVITMELKVSYDAAAGAARNVVACAQQ